LSKPGAKQYAVTLAKIKSVLPASQLLGLGGDRVVTATDFVRILVEDAAAGAHVPQMPGDIGRTADGTHVCQFPSTVSTQVAPLKLLVLRETWGVGIEQTEPTRVVLRRTASGGLWGMMGGKKKSGLEVVVTLPPVGQALGEITVTGGLFGSPDRDFAAQAANAIPQLIAEVRKALMNVDDRRQHPRVAATFPVTLYPVHSAGGIDLPVHGRLRDVSRGGLCVVTEGKLPTKYAYAHFAGVEELAEWAVLVRFLRSEQTNRECVHGGQFRVDL
jgi:hypothetical protein